MARAGFLLLFFGAGCTALLGDDFEVVGDGSGGAVGGTQPQGGGGYAQGGAPSGSTAGSGGTATGSGGTTTGSGVGGGAAGGGGAGGCTLGTTQGCTTGFKCSVVTPATGEIDCVPAGPRIAFQVCSLDTECVAGTWCDPITNVCKPICSGGLSCPDLGDCYATAVPGLDICTADCAPDVATPCVQSSGTTVCGRTENGLDCMRSSGVQPFENCIADGTCTPGYFCDTQASVCWEWCKVGDPSNCVSGSACVSLDPQVYDNSNVEYGVCIVT